MSHLILATDGSGGARVAEELIGAIRWPAGTTVHIASVVPRLAQIDPARPWAGRPMRPDETVAQTERAAALTAEAATRLAVAAPALASEQHVLLGGAVAAIGRLADEVGADLIVVGRHGQTAVEGRTLGSVAAAIADDSACPVLVARASTLGRTLIADDGSAGSSEAVGYLRDRPWLLGTAARFAAVIPIERSCSEAFDLAVDPRAIRQLDALGEESLAEAAAWLAADVNVLRQVGCDASLEIATETGVPGVTLVAAAIRWRADLVVVGSRAKAGNQRLFFGSVGRYVVHNAPSSVLLVPQLDQGSRRPAKGPASVPLVAV